MKPSYGCRVVALLPASEGAQLLPRLQLPPASQRLGQARHARGEPGANATPGNGAFQAPAADASLLHGAAAPLPLRITHLFATRIRLPELNIHARTEAQEGLWPCVNPPLSTLCF